GHTGNQRKGGVWMRRYAIDPKTGRLHPGPEGAVRVLSPAELTGPGAPALCGALARLLQEGGSRVVQYPDCLLGLACLPGPGGEKLAFWLDDRALWLAAETPPALTDLPLDAAP